MFGLSREFWEWACLASFLVTVVAASSLVGAVEARCDDPWYYLAVIATAAFNLLIARVHDRCYPNGEWEIGKKGGNHGLRNR